MKLKSIITLGAVIVGSGALLGGWRVTDIKSMHYKETQYGFDYGAAKVTRLFSDEKKGWVTLGIETPKHSGNAGLQIYITKTGKVRIHDCHGEWNPPNEKS